MPEPRLTLVMKPGSDGGLLPAILDAYRDKPGAVKVDVHTCAAGEQPRLLRRGAADVAFVHQRQTGLDQLDTEVLLIEHQVAALPVGHRLATATDVRLAELEGELLQTDQVAANPSEALQLVALGRAVVLLPASLQDQIRRDVVCVPVRDAAPTTLLIAWPPEHRSPALASFVHTAAKVAAAASNAVGFSGGSVGLW